MGDRLWLWQFVLIVLNGFVWHVTPHNDVRDGFRVDGVFTTAVIDVVGDMIMLHDVHRGVTAITFGHRDIDGPWA